MKEKKRKQKIFRDDNNKETDILRTLSIIRHNS